MIRRKTMKKRILSAILALCMITAANIPSYAEKADTLRFDENGEFKILHLCDGQDNFPAKEKMITYINHMLKIYKPDLVVLGGDNTVASEETKEQAIEEYVKPFVENGVYFTLVFGNHDDEQGVDKDTLLEYYQKYGGKYCLAYEADPSLHGAAIHNLPVLSSDGSKIRFNLWMFDTNTYVLDDDGNRLGYDNVREDQIEWYKETAARLEAEAGEKIHSLAFQHMVPPEVYEAIYPEVSFSIKYVTETYNDGKNYLVLTPNTSAFRGHIYEPASPGIYNHGHFSAMAENGDVIGVFSGHDHINDYVTEYEGIKIVNTPGVSYNAYGNEFTRGSRLITVREDNTSEFTSEVITVNDAAFADADFAEEIGISRFAAGAWKFFEHWVLGIVKHMSGIAYFIY